MGLFATPGAVKELVTEDVHDAVCAEVFDLGLQPEKFEGQDERMVPKAIFVFQVGERDSTGKRKEVKRKLTVSLSDRANLHKLCEQWLGSGYLKAYGTNGGLDLNTLVGRPLRLSVGVKVSTQGKDYNAINSALKPGANVLTVENYTPLAERGDFYTNLRDGQQQSSANDDDGGIPF